MFHPQLLLSSYILTALHFVSLTKEVIVDDRLVTMQVRLFNDRTNKS